MELRVLSDATPRRNGAPGAGASAGAGCVRAWPPESAVVVDGRNSRWARKPQSQRPRWYSRRWRSRPQRWRSRRQRGSRSLRQPWPAPGQDFAVDVHVTGPNAAKVAGFQVNALVNGTAANVVTAIPGLAGARMLDPGSTGGSANVGFFGGRAGTAPTDVVAHVLITPLEQGRLQVRLARPILVDAQGNVLHARVGKRVLIVQVGTKTTGLFRAPHEGRSGAHAHARHSRDLSGDGKINIGDVGGSVVAWQSAPSNAPACSGRPPRRTSPATPAPRSPTSRPWTRRRPPRSSPPSRRPSALPARPGSSTRPTTCPTSLPATAPAPPLRAPARCAPRSTRPTAATATTRSTSTSRAARTRRSS